MVDVILYRQLSCALVRFSDSWRVTSVPLPAQSAARQWKFDFSRFSKSHPDGFSAAVKSLAQEGLGATRAPTVAGHKGRYKQQQQQPQVSDSAGVPTEGSKLQGEGTSKQGTRCGRRKAQ